jgi:AraC-like DNA-binding protein
MPTTELGPRLSDSTGRACAGAAPEHWVPSLAEPGKREDFSRESLVREIAFGEPHPRLRGYVLGYFGGSGRNTGLSTAQRVPPECAVMLSLSFTPSPRRLVTASSGASNLPALGVAGLHDRFQLIEVSGPMAGVLVALTPPGAYALFRVAMRELANAHVPLSDLVGSRANHLAEQLACAATWSERFAILDQNLASWSGRGRIPDTTLMHAWWLIQQSRGGLRIGQLAAELGCSRRYLEKKFSERVGLSPKTVARIWRFQHAAHLLLGTPGQPWSEIAHTCGYTDQAHLNRDFRSLAGCTPTQLLAARPHALRATAESG